MFGVGEFGPDVFCKPFQKTFAEIITWYARVVKREFSANVSPVLGKNLGYTPRFRTV
jgi:hypothetical protein